MVVEFYLSESWQMLHFPLEIQYEETLSIMTTFLKLELLPAQ